MINNKCPECERSGAPHMEKNEFGVPIVRPKTVKYVETIDGKPVVSSAFDLSDPVTARYYHYGAT